MSADSVNHFFNFLGLNTGNFRVFYDFRSGDFLQSVSGAQSQFSGTTFNQGDFFKQDPYSNEEGGIGDFSKGIVKINHAEQLNSNSFTFIFSQEKTGSKGGSIFSSLGQGEINSGFSFGINDANKLYFEYYANNQPVNRSSLNIVGDKNLYALKFNNGNLSFLYYNNNTCDFEKESFSLPSTNFLNSNEWYLGSGINQNRYEGYLDKFLYFDTNISDANLVRLMSGFWTDVETQSQTGFLLPTGQITGYTNELYFITGIISQEQAFSGFDTTFIDQEIFEFRALTGNINSGDKQLNFLENLPQFCAGRPTQPIYYESVAQQAGTGITGFEFVLSGTGQIEIQKSVFQTVINTGVISSGIISTPLFNTGQEPIVTTQTIVTPNIPLINSYGMDIATYLGFNGPPSDLGAMYLNGFEIYLNGFQAFLNDDPLSVNNWIEGRAFTGENKINFLNKIAAFNNSTLRFQLSSSFNSGEVDLYKDGFYQLTGKYTITGGPIEFGIDIENDYFVSGNRVLFSSSISSSDFVEYDFNNTGEIFVYNSGDFSGNTLPVDINCFWFFQDGRKLISGLDYEMANGYFSGNENTSFKRTVAVQKRDNQIELFNDSYIRRIKIPNDPILNSGTTGEHPQFGLYTGILNSLPYEFKSEDGSYFINSGIFPSGEYISNQGLIFYPEYTGWQLYSGSGVYDVKFDLENPPISGWEDGTTLTYGWNTAPQHSVSGEKFLRTTSTMFQNRVRDNNRIEHGKSNLIKGNQVFDRSLSNFFINL